MSLSDLDVYEEMVYGGMNEREKSNFIEESTSQCATMKQRRVGESLVMSPILQISFPSIIQFHLNVWTIFRW